MFALFTDLPMDEVDNLINTDIVNAKRILSYEMTKFVRGEEDAILAQKTAEEVFRGAGISENMPTVEVDKAEFGSGLAICEMLEKIKICASRGEARRLIEQGGISLDGEKVTDAAETKKDQTQKAENTQENADTATDASENADVKTETPETIKNPASESGQSVVYTPIDIRL